MDVLSSIFHSTKLQQDSYRVRPHQVLTLSKSFCLVNIAQIPYQNRLASQVNKSESNLLHRGPQRKDALEPNQLIVSLKDRSLTTFSKGQGIESQLLQILSQNSLNQIVFNIPLRIL